VDKQQQLEGPHVHGIENSELKRKFQEALRDSQINDSKVSATSASYPSATRENLTQAAEIADRVS